MDFAFIRKKERRKEKLGAENIVVAGVR